MPELTPGAGFGSPADLHLLADVELTVTVELGRVRLPLRDLLRLQEGTVVELDRLAGAPVDVLANGTPVARGDVVVVGDELGVRIAELVGRVPS
ncbi:flagellar motor switch protein FliN [Nitriliruptoraceae bacterium ZYF776]|nr:flagellar motor switch protein FliN [Profundirhabdus halotolerans]